MSNPFPYFADSNFELLTVVKPKYQRLFINAECCHIIFSQQKFNIAKYFVRFYFPIYIG